MFKRVLIGLGIVVAGFIAFIAARPATFRIERSTKVSAPAEVVFAQVNDFHRWNVWSPWEKLDPSMKKTFSGPYSGEGAHYAWVGNDKIGEGSMTITSAQPPQKIVIKLEFIKPFAATNVSTFAFASAGNDTTVTWSMEGENGFMAKAASVFMNMDKMVGDDFDRGLAQLKVVSEAEAKRLSEQATKAIDAPAEAAAAGAHATPPAPGNAAPTPAPGGKPGAPPPVAPPENPIQPPATKK